MTRTDGKASDVLERMRRTATKESAQSPPLPQQTHASAIGADREKVRYTLDLTGGQHHFLKRFAVDAGVDASRVMRALLTLLAGDNDLAERVMQHLSKCAMQ